MFASAEALDTVEDRILACSDRYVSPIAERILPDGAVHLIFNFGDRPSGERGAELACMAMGATCEPTRVVFRGAVEQVCVSVRVGGAAAVLGVPVGAVTDHGVSLDALWGASATETLEQLHAAPAAMRIGMLARVLRERVRRAEPASVTVLEAVRRITASAGRIRVRELAAELGVGERRLQQLFHAHVGLSPKETCRLARFRAVLALRRDARRSWTDVALDVGYCDQAHLVHELRAFTGLTPSELARRGDFAFLQDGSAGRG